MESRQACVERNAQACYDSSWCGGYRDTMSRWVCALTVCGKAVEAGCSWWPRLLRLFRR